MRVALFAAFKPFRLAGLTAQQVNLFAAYRRKLCNARTSGGYYSQTPQFIGAMRQLRPLCVHPYYSHKAQNTWCVVLFSDGAHP